MLRLSRFSFVGLPRPTAFPPHPHAFRCLHQQVSCPVPSFCAWFTSAAATTENRTQRHPTVITAWYYGSCDVFVESHVSCLSTLIQQMTEEAIVSPSSRPPRPSSLFPVSSCSSDSWRTHLFCFYCALRQWRRGNNALIKSLPVLGCPNSLQHLQPKCLEDRFLLSKQGKMGTAVAPSLSASLPTIQQS